MARSNTEDRILLLAKKQVEGTLTEQEKIELDQWYSSFDDTEITTETENTDGLKESGLIKEKIFNRINEKIGKAGQAGYKTPIIQLRRAVWIRVAAGIILPVSLFATAFYFFLYKPSAPQYLTVSAPKGKVIQIVLPDSSKLWLNAASTIKYPTTFNKTRDIYLLEGEAYFDVTHNPQKPFIVHSSGVDTRVLGTAFSVKAYKHLDNIQVIVARGKVAVGDRQKTLGLLTPNQKITYNKNTHEVKQSQATPNEAIGWTKGDFVLSGVYFKDMVLAIENRFDVRLKYNDKTFKNCQNSIRFKASHNLRDVMNLVKDIQGLDYSIKGDTVLITGAGCK